LNNVLNLIGSQLLWLAAVGGAANDMAWLGPSAFLLFAGWQLFPGRRAKGDVTLVLIALPLGLLVDSTMAATGLARYASPGPIAWLAPMWILTLWMGFALTFNHSLANLMRRSRWAVAFGAVAGPLSYWVAQRAWGAVEFASPQWVPLLVLGVLWGVAMGLLALACKHYSAPQATLQSSVEH